MSYKRGSGSVEVELANIQSEVERLGPALDIAAAKIDSLESTRDNIRGMFVAIIAMQSFVIGIIVWALNHIQTVQVIGAK